MKKLNIEDIEKIFKRPLISLVSEACSIHQKEFPHGKIQASSLLSIKTGGCPENCTYCPQSAHYNTGVSKSSLLTKDEVIQAALKAKEMGANRFCMGAAWREIRDGVEFDQVCELVSAVSNLNLEVCCTLGMLTGTQARKLKSAGLDFYNHNIDTSPEFYDKIVQTRTYSDRLETLLRVRQANLKICTGGILGMGESDHDRMSFIQQIVNMETIPESITINMLVRTKGTPLENVAPIDPLDIVRTIATIRILAPRSMIRLSAGRTSLSSEAQFLCFISGANSIFLGDKLLTSPNPDFSEDQQLLEKCGLSFSQVNENESHDL
ncbi:MAG: biotin synthase BioB [Bacteriovorax sp.]|nr:biotin synthase BioB [Bacteriovorax sp.]